MIDVRWVTVFADVPAVSVPTALEFWANALDKRAGPRRGNRGEYQPLLPENGDDYVWLQRVGRDHGGWHPDLHVAVVADAVDAAVAIGAEVEHVHDADVTTLRSPSGLPFCVVRERAERRVRPAPASWPGGRSAADQLCLDLPIGVHDAEVRFWRRLTGWTFADEDSPEFSRLNGPDHLPVQFLLQRLGPDDTGAARAHLDIAADDRAAEVARHVTLGAQAQYVERGWTTLRDPAGLFYCVTDRVPFGDSTAEASSRGRGKIDG